MSVSFNVEISAKIGQGGYGSFSWPRDVDFTGSGAEVYVGTKYQNGWLHLESVDDGKVPAGTGVLLKGAAGAVVHPQTVGSAAAVGTNLLAGTATETVTSNATQYALATKTQGTGLYKVQSGVEIPKYKAYLTVGGSEGSSREAVFFGSEADGIAAVSASAGAGVTYDLQGRRTGDHPQKGVYLRGGRKVVVK